MKVIENGNICRIIHGTSISDQLSPDVYELSFNKDEGHYLIRTGMNQEPEQMFGPMAGKVEKVFKTFERRECSTGVILSGEKGLGKSLFSRNLMQLGIDNYIPIIVVKDLLPGVSNFIRSIEQPAIYMFDEFEKVFTKGDPDDPSVQDNQVQFLSLLDGIDGTKRLFIITCNNLYRINEYFVDRPGRFYYHFTFLPPDSKTAIAYMKHLGIKKKVDLDEVGKLSTIMNLNFDSLRAIAEELKAGFSLEDSIADLNISNGCGDTSKNMHVVVETTDGMTLENDEYDNNFALNSNVYIRLYDISSNDEWRRPVATGHIYTRHIKCIKEDNGNPVFGFTDLENCHSLNYCRNFPRHKEGTKIKIKRIEITLSNNKYRSYVDSTRDVYKCAN